MRTGEVWKPVPGWPYAVSSHGRVRRSAGGRNTHAGRMLKASAAGFVCPQGTRYQRVRLCDKGRERRAPVHCLVMEAFVGPPPDGMNVDHINSRRDDNRLENLRYVDAKWNVGSAHIGELCPASELTAEQVVEARRRYRDGDATFRGLAREYGVGKETIRSAVRGVQWAHLPGAVPRPPRVRKSATCDHCGAAFTYYASVRSGRWCSQSCYVASGGRSSSSAEVTGEPTPRPRTGGIR